MTRLYVRWLEYHSTEYINHRPSLIHARSTHRKESSYSCPWMILREKNGERLHGDNTEASSLPEVSLWHWPCVKWHLRFYVVYVSASVLPPCARIRPDTVRRCVAYRPDCGCHGHSLRRFTFRQKWWLLAVQIRQKENLALTRYCMHTGCFRKMLALLQRICLKKILTFI